MTDKYTDPKTQNKDAMLSDFYSSLNRTPKKAFKAARQALSSLPYAAQAMAVVPSYSAGKALKKKTKNRKQRNAPY